MKLNQLIDGIIERSFQVEVEPKPSTEFNVFQMHRRLEVLTLEVSLLRELTQFMAQFGHESINDQCLRQFVLVNCHGRTTALFHDRFLLDKVTLELKAKVEAILNVKELPACT